MILHKSCINCGTQFICTGECGYEIRISDYNNRKEICACVKCMENYSEKDIIKRTPKCESRFKNYPMYKIAFKIKEGEKSLYVPF